ncbi:MAG: diphthine synthase [archaeon GB-1867-005]|nr:diphthine synthase [Candidatus Culexmicrobium cathedralense]
MLAFVGLGLYSERNMSIEGLEVAKKADRVYLDTYTSFMPGLSVARLEEMIGKKIIKLKREDIESQKARKILEAAEEGNVVLLVPGDPFVATTHMQLRLEAERRGIKTRVIHASSIFSAISGETGLFSYKFGRSVTVTFPHEGYVSETAYEVVKENKERGLHTLLLLDIDVEGRRFMSVSEALTILTQIESRRKEEIIKEDTLIVGLARLGGADAIVKADFLSNIINYDFGGPPHSIVIPGKLHFVEAEALITLAGAPRTILNYK